MWMRLYDSVQEKAGRRPNASDTGSHGQVSTGPYSVRCRVFGDNVCLGMEVVFANNLLISIQFISRGARYRILVYAKSSRFSSAGVEV